jgi:hypothetical protein
MSRALGAIGNTYLARTEGQLTITFACEANDPDSTRIIMAVANSTCIPAVCFLKWMERILMTYAQFPEIGRAARGARRPSP